MTPPPWDDDATLLAQLGEALGEARDVPENWSVAGDAAFAWRTVDADLAIAELVFDSTRDSGLAVRALRGGSDRTLAFGGGGVIVEIEVTPEGVAGQLIPGSVGRVVCQTADGVFDEASVDAVGCFVLRPPPPGPVRLHARTEQYTVATSWVCLT